MELFRNGPAEVATRMKFLSELDDDESMELLAYLVRTCPPALWDNATMIAIRRRNPREESPHM